MSAPIAPTVRLGVAQQPATGPRHPNVWFAFCAPCAPPTPKAQVNEIETPVPVSTESEVSSRLMAASDRPSAVLPESPAPLYTTQFAFDSAALTVEGSRHLEGIAQTLAHQNISITGYTDDVGPDDYNDDLALRRAAAVKDALVALGLVPEAIGIRGRGSCCFVAPNTTWAGRAANRRAEIHFAHDVPLPRPRGDPFNNRS